MGRTVAIVWHASFSVAAGVLYFFFVLPRWPELLGDTSPTLGTALRIVTGALVGLAALPVVFTLLRTRKPEYGTPQLALTLRISSIVLHVMSGLLIVGTAVGEIWLSLDSAGRWLFGIYGAAAAVALLGMFTFYLAFAAELPPPPPKPLKLKEPRRRRERGKAAEQEPEAVEEPEEPEEPEATEHAEGKPEADEEPSTGEEPPADEDQPAEQDGDETGGLRNRRPSGRGSSSRRRRRSRAGVALED